jgi:hypothetical protein
VDSWAATSLGSASTSRRPHSRSRTCDSKAPQHMGGHMPPSTQHTRQPQKARNQASVQRKQQPSPIGGECALPPLGTFVVISRLYLVQRFSLQVINLLCSVYLFPSVCVFVCVYSCPVLFHRCSLIAFPFCNLNNLAVFPCPSGTNKTFRHPSFLNYFSKCDTCRITGSAYSITAVNALLLVNAAA